MWTSRLLRPTIFLVTTLPFCEAYRDSLGGDDLETEEQEDSSGDADGNKKIQAPIASAELDVPDGYEDDYTHFHVTPSTHRAVLRSHSEQVVTLAVIFALHPVASVLELTLPLGYTLEAEASSAGKAAECPQVFVPDKRSEPGSWTSAYASETQAKTLVPHITKCEVLDKPAPRGDSSAALAPSSSEQSGSEQSSSEESGSDESSSEESSSNDPELNESGQPVWFDCEAYAWDWKRAWSKERQIWCCKEEHFCPWETTQTTTEAEDSEEDLTSFQPQDPEMPVRLKLHLQPNVTFLSAKRAPVSSTEGDENATVQPLLQWWYFHVDVRYPSRSPNVEDNFFRLHWASDLDTDWEGAKVFKSWSILGDWDCRYSDWEGWGACSTRCGGGTRMLTRRVLEQPPSGEVCNDTLKPDAERCNDHPCLFDCTFKKDPIEEGDCSASCGGGVRFAKYRYEGDFCPNSSDKYAEILEPCNQQPCSVRCRHSPEWTVQTSCDELCGLGHFWIIRKVIQKARHDTACTEVRMQLPCMRQICTQFALASADANLLPRSGEPHTVALSFAQKTRARAIEIEAPYGYSFGQTNSTCQLTYHSLMPHFHSCQVDDETENKARLNLLTPLPAAREAGAMSGAATGRYELQIGVYNPECASKDWKHNIITNALLCDTGPDRNRWKISFAPADSYVSWPSLDTQGYPLYWPEGKKKPEHIEKAEEEDTEEENAAAEAAAAATTTSTTGGGGGETSEKEDDDKAAKAEGRKKLRPDDHDTGREKTPIYCMGDREVGLCEAKAKGAFCNWLGVCEVKDDRVST
eukprot:TRINITY_DN36241_c0_g1_i1.p1 TRINITY_DN36241_c0_g1~~TRINITY_DN36241_c0_g1_i1.p1  ORF type:complete len:805 (-),score=152.70 TRINITY_DN36241_c0_g1_i1:13-2427(-)